MQDMSSFTVVHCIKNGYLREIMNPEEANVNSGQTCMLSEHPPMNEGPKVVSRAC